MLQVDEAPTPLVIGIDARAATEVKAGRGRVVRELLRALAARAEPHRYICYAREPWEQDLDGRFQWATIRARDPVWHVRVASAADRECDVFLSSNSYLTVLLLRIPSVAIVYDLVTFDPGMRPNLRSMMVERLTLGATVRRAGRLLCISRATADDLIKRFPRSREKIKLAPLGVAPELARGEVECPGLPPPGFVLAVGTLEPRKNLPRLIEAYASLPAHVQAEHPLVIVGASGWRTGETRAAMRRLGDRCIALGHVSDAVLSELYRRCAIFCYPSLGEGFGLPVLEAMAAGAAVLTSNLSALPEVGGEAVEYVDPRSVGSIASGLDRLLASPDRRKELSESARKRAAGFSWALTAERTLEALREVVA